MELQAAYEDIRAQGAEVVAVSTDNTADARRMADYAQAAFPILADEGAAVTKNYGVYNLLDDGVAAPATFIIRSDGTGVRRTASGRTSPTGSVPRASSRRSATSAAILPRKASPSPGARGDGFPHPRE